jgi:UDPglucose 6-dehydrogenase
MRVAVIGAGYVGLTTAACLSHLGHDVVCADIDEERVARLRDGEVPILEEGLPKLVEEGLKSKRLQFVIGAPVATKGAELVFLCVATPQGDDGRADLTYIRNAVREIAPVLESGAVVINKSTVPVGSAQMVQDLLVECGVSADSVHVASNPEFLREGQAVRDFLNPDRVVVGCDDQDAAAKVAELYRDLRAPVLVTDPASAEMIKYASNAFLATKISFINAVANLCEAVGADVREVALGMGYDKRIGSQFLHPGPGYGGSCFPKDTAALLYTSDQVGYKFGLLEGVRDVNRLQHERMVTKIREAAGGSLKGKTVAALGLTFKAETDDLRDSPAMWIAERLLEEDAVVQAYDPAGGEAAQRTLPGLDVRADAYDAATGAHVLAVLTEWDEFRWLDYAQIHGSMANPAIVDTRNLLDPPTIRKRGFAYVGVGR